MALGRLECIRCDPFHPYPAVAAVRLIPLYELAGLCGQHLDEVKTKIDQYGTMYEVEDV